MTATAAETPIIAGSDWSLNADCTFYTRNPAPAAWRNPFAVMDFTPGQLRFFNAVHEAGHAVLFQVFGVTVESMKVLDTEPQPDEKGFIQTAYVTIADLNIPALRYWSALAAGERAADRWMRDAGLWTPTRAWAAERGAHGDRRMVADSIRKFNGDTLTYGLHDDMADYAVIEATADAALNRVWPQVLALATALDRSGELNGTEAARITGFTPELIGGMR